jgi:hypothetical protein
MPIHRIKTKPTIPSDDHLMDCSSDEDEVEIDEDEDYPPPKSQKVKRKKQNKTYSRGFYYFVLQLIIY